MFKCLTDKFVDDYDNAYNIVVTVLNKEIPYKVEEGTEGGYDWYCKCCYCGDYWNLNDKED